MVTNGVPRDRGPAGTVRWLPLPVGILVVAAGLSGAAAGVGPLAEHVAAAVAGGALVAALTAPLVFVAVRRTARRGRPVPYRALAVAAAVLLMTYVATGLPRVGPFAELRWNWQGKLVDLLWVGALLWVVRRWSVDAAGLRARWEPGSVRPAVTAIWLLALGWFGISLLGLWAGGMGTEDLTVERLLYDTTVPNLTEELVWRGVLLAVLDQALGTPRRLWGAPVGWGLVLTAVAFGLGHGVVVEPGHGLRVLPANAVLTALGGALFAWLRARTGSLLPAYLAHCAAEVAVLGALAAWVASG